MSLAADVAATLQPGFVGPAVPAWLVEAREAGLVSVCLYGDNASPEGGLGPVCDDLHARLPGVLLAVDEEGGDVTRVHYPQGSPAVGNAVLGRLDDEELTRRSAAAIGAELAHLGIGLDLAPVVDVNSSADNPVIGVRSLGADPALVARHGVAWVEGLQSTGVAACAKHFPGHGDTVVDSHHGLPRVDVPVDVLRERELAPFAAAVRAGVASVMTSHVIVSSLDPDGPATFSPTVVRVLREELGFDGVLVSDALDMAGASAETGIPEAAVRALAAGVDLLCLGSATTAARFADVRAAVVEAVESGRLSRERVAEAAGRVRRLAEAHARPPSSSPRTPAGSSRTPASRVSGGSAQAGPSAEPDEGALSDGLTVPRHGPDVPSGAPSDAAVAATFTTSPAVADFVADHAPLAVVQVGSSSNLAVGAVSWGPASVGATVAESAVPVSAKVAVVGRAMGAAHPAHGVADRLRATGHRVVLVECGWPRGGADLETFGGSPAVARALLALLRGEVAP